jgi:hypothetical protein
MTIWRMTVAFLILCLALGCLTPLMGQALPLGSIAVSKAIVPCSAVANNGKFYTGMLCQQAFITCPNAAQIGLTYGWTGPTNPQGTIVMFSGGSGTSPTEQGDDILTYAANYISNFQIIQVEWASAWEDPSSDGSGGNVLNAACRPATFLNYINTSLRQGAMCAQGGSAGGAAIGYAMAWYGAASYIATAVFTSGPTLSEMDQGCTYPNASTPTICGSGSTYCSSATKSWTDRIIYVPHYNADVSAWTGIAACATPQVNSANYPTWAAMSLVDGSTTGANSTFNFQSTTKHSWLCAGYQLQQCNPPSCPNNSASEGKYFYDAVAKAGDTNVLVSGVTNCVGEEGVAQGNDPDNGLPVPQAIQRVMIQSCH